jgi:chorismate mutase
LERADRAGVRHLGAIHRGFSGYPKSVYRNWPLWDLPLELRRRVPDLPLYCDPSHICGTRDTIREVARKALDLQYDGLMIESHICPDEAWSDAQQQLTPADLSTVLERLLHREQGNLEPLEELRSKIDRLDRELLNLLAERMAVAESIGLEKLVHHLDAHQPERWQEALQDRLLEARERNLGQEFVERLFAVIHHESVVRQQEMMRKKQQLSEMEKVSE